MAILSTTKVTLKWGLQETMDTGIPNPKLRGIVPLSTM